MSSKKKNQNRKGKPLFNQDTKAMIDHCLSCPWNSCWNCLGRGNEYSKLLRFELTESQK